MGIGGTVRDSRKNEASATGLGEPGLRAVAGLSDDGSAPVRHRGFTGVRAGSQPMRKAHRASTFENSYCARIHKSSYMWLVTFISRVRGPCVI